MMKREKLIKSRVSEAEYSDAEQLASAYGMTISALIRYLLRTTKPPKRREA